MLDERKMRSMRCQRREFQIPAWRRSSAASPIGGQQVLALRVPLASLSILIGNA